MLKVTMEDQLLEVHERRMEEQQRTLSLIFEEWSGVLSQIDEVHDRFTAIRLQQLTFFSFLCSFNKAR